jgi:hypothetical protein
MYCLLCHEKIPRLRAWRTKSEFCCDEHAALYKKQTLERLLVDPAANQNGQSELPEPPEPDEFELEELEAQEIAEEAPQVAAREQDNGRPNWQEMDFPGEFESDSDLPPPVTDQEEMDELRHLASEVGGGYRGGYGEGVYFADEGRGVRDVSRQSAEEALEALRQLASRAKPAPPAEQEDAAQVAPAPAAELESVDRGFNQDAVLTELHDLAQNERFGPEANELEDVAALAAADELDAPDPIVLPRAQAGEENVSAGSILDELMEDPLTSWQDSRDLRAGRKSRAFDFDPAAPLASQEAEPPAAETAETPASQSDEERGREAVEISACGADGEAAEALQELMSALDDGAPDQIPSLDLDAPEPDWAFAGDDASELAALKESLAKTGTAEARFAPESKSGLDIVPEEPDWEDLDVELDEQDIEPPEPLLEIAAEAERDEEPLAAPVAPRASLQAVAENNGAPQGERTSHVRQAPSTRFRAIFEFAEIHLRMADWPGASSQDDPLGDAVDIRSLRLRQLEIVPPVSRETLLPEGRATGPGASGSISMHEDSVNLEPVASLEIGSLGDLAPRLEPAASPFAPGGLFFDLAGGAAGFPLDDDEAESSVTAGGAKR